MCITADDFDVREYEDLLEEKLRYDLWVDAAYETKTADDEVDDECIKVLYKQPDGYVEVMEIENDLETLQRLVGGYIEHVHLPVHIIAIVDEEGCLKNSELNMSIGGYTLYGNIVFASDDGDDIGSLTESQIKYLQKIIEEEYQLW